MKVGAGLADNLRLLRGVPTLGCLVELCESNFALLEKLVPNLPDVDGRRYSQLHGSAPLLLQVLERTPYTVLARLSYSFGVEESGKADLDLEPDTRLRVYFDARQAEVIALRQSVLPLGGLYEAPGLEQKWKANHFVNRWLAFCLLQGHEIKTKTAPSRRLFKTQEFVDA